MSDNSQKKVIVGMSGGVDSFRFLFQPLHLFAKVQCSLDRTID
jgi:7-cyano-7-deazaguanine synthase in queuosine biosynthesis